MAIDINSSPREAGVKCGRTGSHVRYSKVFSTFDQSAAEGGAPPLSAIKESSAYEFKWKPAGLEISIMSSLTF